MTMWDAVLMRALGEKHGMCVRRRSLQPTSSSSAHDVVMHTRTHRGRHLTRTLLGAALIFAGTSHLTFAREAFQAQVPEFVPLDADTTVVASGIAEVALGTALVVAQGKRAKLIGTLAAVFFAAIFPGNISQYLHRRDGFGLDTDRKRLVRLFFQPALVATAIWSTRR